MRLPNSKHDMLAQISKDTGRSREIVRFVINDFEAQLRHRLANPLETGNAILLKGFGKFTFDREKAAKRMHYLKMKSKKEYYEQFFERFNEE